jgi:Flp pilus assembly protein TadD/SAM-dependent methyltransferase
MTTNEPNPVASAMALHKRGRLAEAEAAYRVLLADNPAQPPVLHLLGIVRLQQGDAAEAVALLREALAAGRREAALYRDLGAALRMAGRPEEAVRAYRAALPAQPDDPATRLGLAAALHAAGELPEAIRTLEEGLRRRPEDRRTRFNLATLLVEAGRFDEAVAGFRPLAESQPEDDRARAGLAGALFGAGDLAGAEAAFRRSLEAAPDDPDRLCGLGRVLLAAERPQEAETVLRRALALAPRNASARFNLGLAMARNGTLDAEFLATWFAAAGPVPPVVRAAVIDALKDAPAVRASSATTSPIVGPALTALAAAPLLQPLLRRTLVDDFALERVLVRARRGCVDDPEAAPTDFVSALAWQCFLNEYVYPETREEATAAAALGETLADALAAAGPLDPAALARYACYRPLHTLSRDRELMSRADLPGSLRALIRQQVAEPREERLIAASLPRLTPIDDAVSRAVQAQYEDHPYPRWQGRSRLVGASAERVLTGLFPHLAARTIAWPDSPAILVAGCGTGHHSIATAQRFANSRMTAVDLSLASLAYAARKTREAGLENVDYAQADILELGTLTQRFDIVESAGVLHHMADPLAGWRVLRGLLAPGGFMKIGLYSERGRQSIVAARAVMSEAGLSADAAGIRAGRMALAALPESHPARQVVERPDFYSMSTCRDMIFHVQEHRFDLPRIEAMIAELELEFVGFELASRASARAYRARFPDDPAMLSLADWDAFEADHPGTFAGMFLFWVCDAGVHHGV